MIEFNPEKPCADCGGTLVDITLFSRSVANPISGAACDSEMMYSAGAGAGRSAFLSMFKKSGTVSASLCSDCHRIFLYGHPHD